MTREPIQSRTPFAHTRVLLSNLIAFVLIFCVPSPGLARAAFTVDDPPAYPVYDMTPPVGTPGADYVVTVLSRDPNRREITDKCRFVPPVGITVTGFTPTSSNSFTVRITIPKETPLGECRFLVKDKETPKEGQDDSRVIGTADFDVTVVPGPIPPGMDPQVDVMWGVMGKEIVHHNFGHKIADNYYAIQLTIGNDSGFDLQIAGVGFRLPASSEITNVVPTNSYRATRGTLERAQQVGFRATLLSIAKGLGNLYTGFLPFWRSTTNPNRKANAGLWGTIVNGPFIAGLEGALPDTTVRQLTRLDDQTLRDGLIVKNNSQVVTLVWVPKRLLNLSKRNGDMDPDNPRRFKDDPKKKGQRIAKTAADGLYADGITNWRDDPQYVNKKLGELVILGQAIKYLNRVQVVRTAEGAGVTPPPTVLGTDIQVAKQGDEPTIVFSGDHLEGSSVVGPTGIQFPDSNISIDKNGHVLRAKAVISKDIKPDTYTVFLSSPGGRSNPVSLRIDPAPPADIDATPKNIKVTDKDQDITIVITGKFLKDSKLVPKKVEKVLDVKDDAKSSFDRLTQTVQVIANAKKAAYTLELEGPGGKAAIKITLE